MKTWRTDWYTVEEREFDYDLHQFVVVKRDGTEHPVIPGDLDAQAYIIAALDRGDDVNGWDDGAGGTVTIYRINVGNNIRDQRLSANLTQKQLAARMGVAQARVVEWEKGYRDPTADTLIRIGLAIGIEPRELLK